MKYMITKGIKMTDQLAEDKKLLGTVFYEVLTDSDNVPWINRMKLTYISPKLINDTFLAAEVVGQADAIN